MREGWVEDFARGLSKCIIKLVGYFVFSLFFVLVFDEKVLERYFLSMLYYRGLKIV